MKKNNFLSDINVPGMLYARTIRSPVAKGELENIIYQELPESYFLLSTENTNFNNELYNFDLPILAKKELSYTGQPVAIIGGPDDKVLLDIRDSVFLETNDEDASFDMDNFSEEDVLTFRELSYGDNIKEIDEVHEENRLISGTYFTGIQEHWYPEPCGAFAYFEDQKIIINTATQWPYHVKHSVAKALNISPSNVIVKMCNLAIPLDGKLWYPSLLAVHAALAAKTSAKPVMLLLSREEDFLYSPKRFSSYIGIKSSLDIKDELNDTAIEIKLNMGSSGVFKEELIDNSCLGSLGAYRHELYSIKAQGIRTNIPVQGAMSGFGLSQGFFASECHASRIADFLGQDPAEWRKRNLLKDNYLPIGTQLKSNYNFISLIDMAASMSDYYRKWASYNLLRKRRREETFLAKNKNFRGLGLSIAYQGSGFLHTEEGGNGNCSAELTLEKDGSLKIKSSISASYSGAEDAWRIIANEILGVEKHLVEVSNDTQDLLDSGAASLSRNMIIMSELIEKGCNSIKSQRFRDPLPITVKHTIKLSKKAGWQNKKLNLDVFSKGGSAAAVVEVEIDTDSFIPYIRGIWLAADGGRIYSYNKARTAIENGIIHALGWARNEQLHYAQGEIPLDSLRNYDVHSPFDIPPIEVDFISSESNFPKGIGELPYSCIPAAYVQAVSQAMDFHFGKIPLDEKDIYNAAISKQEERSQ